MPHPTQIVISLA